MKFLVKAYNLGRKINLSQLKKAVGYKLIKSEFSFLLFEVEPNSYVYYKNYGSVVFFNVNAHLRTKFLLDIGHNPKEINTIEEFMMHTDSEEMKVDFNDIFIPKLTLDIAHIIMLHLAQSTALGDYLDRSSSLLEQTRKYTDELELKGRVSLGRKRMRKFIAHALNFKNNIAENLFIFETPSLAWTQKGLSDLDNQLKEELDVVNRHHALQNNLNVVSENLDLFKDILQHKHSSTLEWIIIILILLEVIPIFIP